MGKIKSSVKIGREIAKTGKGSGPVAVKTSKRAVRGGFLAQKGASAVAGKAKSAGGAVKGKAKSGGSKVANSRPVLGARTNPKVGKVTAKGKAAGGFAKSKGSAAGAKGKAGAGFLGKKAGSGAARVGSTRPAVAAATAGRRGADRVAASKVGQKAASAKGAAKGVVATRIKNGKPGLRPTMTKKKAAVGVVGAGGYVTYKRKTKSGKVVTVRRKRG